jgi:ABC-type molybdate transport system ATPase subunit
LIEQQGSLSLVSAKGVTLKVSGKVDAPDCTIAVRPEDVSVDLSPITNEAMNILKGTITEFVDQGPTVSITVDAVLHIKVIMTKSFFIEKNLETGQETWLAFKSDSVKIL